jgi:hypothetical protein
MDSIWKGFCRLGGASALILLVYSLVTMVLLVAVGGPPKSAQEGFTLLQNNRLVALLRLDMLTTLVMPVYYLLFLGLYTVLKNAKGALSAIATLLAFAGVTLILAAPSAFSWVDLSDRFSAATADVQKTQLLAAGEAILASDIWHGSAAFVGGLLLEIGALLISVAMLDGKTFGKTIAYWGVLTHGLDLAHILLRFILPTGGIILMAIAGPLYVVWFPLLARDFFRLAKSRSKGVAAPQLTGTTAGFRPWRSTTRATISVMSSAWSRPPNSCTL